MIFIRFFLRVLTGFFLLPFCGTFIFTRLPRFSLSHCSKTAISSISLCSMTSRGIKGVPE